jgi:hypothetical protein
MIQVVNFFITLQFLFFIWSRRARWLRLWITAVNCLGPTDEFKALVERPLDGLLNRFVEYEW